METHKAFWALGIFIDSFDAGDDQNEIVAIAERYSLDSHEVQVLVTPRAPSYVTAWEQALSAMRDGSKTEQEILDEFFWIRTDYHYFAEADADYVRAEAARTEDPHWRSLEAEEATILNEHGLSENPLVVFQELTQWRDDRKRYNFVGLYGIMRLLTEAAGRRGHRGASTCDICFRMRPVRYSIKSRHENCERLCKSGGRDTRFCAHIQTANSLTSTIKRL